MEVFILTPEVCNLSFIDARLALELEHLITSSTTFSRFLHSLQTQDAYSGITLTQLPTHVSDLAHCHIGLEQNSMKLLIRASQCFFL
jgi:hypothetical protein